MPKDNQDWCGLCRCKFKEGEPYSKVVGSEVFEGFTWTNGFKQEDMENMNPVWEAMFEYQGKDPIDCHQGCIDFITPSNVSLDDMNQILEYDWAPMPEENQRRERWLRETMADKLSAWSKRLNQDVAVQVVRRCLTELSLAYAVSNFQAHGRPSEGKERNAMCFVTTRPIWAKWVSFEGNLYVAGLTNRPPQFDEEARCCSLVLRDPARRPSTVCVAFDHLGLRQVMIPASDAKIPIGKRNGVWWRTIKVENSELLEYTSDGVKLRKLRCQSYSPPSPGERDLARMAWAVPQARPQNLRIYSVEETVLPPRMSILACNHAQVTAYFAYWKGTAVTIRAYTDIHAGKNPPVQHPHDRFVEGAAWLFFPLDPGELIAEIWLRSFAEGGNDIYMKTDRGRVWGLAPQVVEARSRVTGGDGTWHLVDRPGKTEDRIFVDDGPYHMGRIAFESERPERGDSVPPVEAEVREHVKPPSWDGSMHFFYSSASLEDVVLVYPCWRETASKPMIVGLLLRYGDGRERNVGQIRPDCLGTPMRVPDSGLTKLYYKYDRFVQSVLDIRICEDKPADDDDKPWIGLPWAGSLTWSFTPNKTSKSRLYYKD